MRLIVSFIVFLILTNCSKPKTVLVCGDHVCINKKEAKQYFEDNLTIEVKIINKKVKNETNLVELNLKQDDDGNKKISVLSKNKTKENLKTLSNEEIKKIKKNIKKKNREKKISKKTKVDTAEKNIQKIDNLKKSDKLKVKQVKKNSVNKNRLEIVDVCTIVEKCSIDEIAKYLLEQGRKKDYPDITTRQ